ncbi:MAG: heavy metal-binding domain-containing protein [Candidatus Cloacimonetes bacterium]|nr:heavy metal-binding domain-containing protein [Candidatus Cloacimonadota bacterium]
MILFTADYRQQNYEIMGTVTGSCVMARNVVSDTVSNVKNLVGGELTHYSELLDQALAIAVGRMKKQAEDLGADAVMAMRISTIDVVTGTAGVLAYGTAIKFC